MIALPDDTRVRIGVALLLVLAVSQLDALRLAAASLALVALLAVATGSAAALWHRLWHVEAFLALLLLTLPLTVPGTELMALGPLSVSHEGVALALLIVCKVAAAALLILMLLGSQDPERIGASLRALRVPERLVRLFLMTLRYLALIRIEGARLQEAMRARSFRPGSNRHTWRSYGHLAGMMLVRALDRAVRVEEAMRCRGFAGRMPQTAVPPLGAAEWGWLTGAAVLALALTLADRA